MCLVDRPTYVGVGLPLGFVSTTMGRATVATFLFFAEALGFFASRPPLSFPAMLSPRVALEDPSITRGAVAIDAAWIPIEDARVFASTTLDVAGHRARKHEKYRPG